MNMNQPRRCAITAFITALAITAAWQLLPYSTWIRLAQMIDPEVKAYAAGSHGLDYNMPSDVCMAAFLCSLAVSLFSMGFYKIKRTSTKMDVVLLMFSAAGFLVFAAMPRIIP